MYNFNFTFIFLSNHRSDSSSLSLFSQKKNSTTRPQISLPFSFLFLLPFLAFDDTLSHNYWRRLSPPPQRIKPTTSSQSNNKTTTTRKITFILPVFKKHPFICMNTLELQQLRWHFTRKNYILYLFFWRHVNWKKFTLLFPSSCFFLLRYTDTHTPSLSLFWRFFPSHTQQQQPCK